MEHFKPLDFIPISKLISPDYKFYVPSYQRGYRWGADHVRQLIEDLLEFDQLHYRRDDSMFYCLQPLVVKERAVSQIAYGQPGDVMLEVIDGQQRLTTVLLILQALHLRRRLIDGENPSSVQARSDMYSIKYETREESSVWMPKLIQIVLNPEALVKFEDTNCDYCHFAEVFKTAYDMMKDWDEDQVSDFGKVLRKGTRFIWYYPTESAGTNAEIFDRLNAGKIRLNNAELIKALFVQKSNWADKDLAYSKALSLEWNAIETQLQDNEFWGFIYRSRHPFHYDTHIEYLFDILQGKDNSQMDNVTFTFDCYLESYRQMMAGLHLGTNEKAAWVKAKWLEVKELFDTLVEWYSFKPVYHRVGFILEYVASVDILSLRRELEGLKRSERIKRLDSIIQKEVSGIKSYQLFYGKSQLSEILFLYNILLEDRRVSDKARFSFASYKEIYKNKGWDQEHVASHTDFSVDIKKAAALALDIIELVAGERPVPDVGGRYAIDYEAYGLDENECILCDRSLAILNTSLTVDDSRTGEKSVPEEDTDIFKLYAAVQAHFKTDDDVFGSALLTDGKTLREEKDFIWNFVLLNAGTNRSYGNNIFPVKRQRILQDEYSVYTPVGTRNVFEKAYSRKSDQMLYWSKSDARAYFEDLKAVLKPYVTISLPFKK